MESRNAARSEQLVFSRGAKVFCRRRLRKFHGFIRENDGFGLGFGTLPCAHPCRLFFLSVKYGGIGYDAQTQRKNGENRDSRRAHE